MRTLLKEGATVKLCQNGREALDVVHKHLVNQRKHEYDYVLMDCQVINLNIYTQPTSFIYVSQCVTLVLKLTCRCQKWMDLKQQGR